MSGNWCADAAARLATRLAVPTGAPGLVFIDGRSGSGKTSLAVALAGELARRGTTPQVLGMDELYPGWDGLGAGSAAVPGVLRAGRYLRYDWKVGAFGDEVQLSRDRTLIVEGCGSLSSASLRAAAEWGRAYAVWIDSPEPLRRMRALARDGDMFAPHWEAWAQQEDVLFALSQPIALANEIVHVA